MKEQDSNIAFGVAVADVVERRQFEEQAMVRKWTLDEVEWFERKLTEETDTSDSTFYRDRAPQMIEAFQRAHKRGDFGLVEDMSRAEFAAYESARTGTKYTEFEVFDRPEIRAITLRLANLQTDRANRNAPPVRLQEPIMSLITSANREGRVMGTSQNLGGAVIRQIRGEGSTKLFLAGAAAFRGESDQTRSSRLQSLFEDAERAVALQAQLRDAVNQLSNMQTLDNGRGGVALRAIRDALSSALDELRREASALKWFSRFILDGDEAHRLADKLAHVKQLIVTAKV